MGRSETIREALLEFRRLAGDKTARQIEAESDGAIPAASAQRYLQPDYTPARLEAASLDAIRAYSMKLRDVPRESSEGGSPDGLSWLRQEFDRIYGMAIDEWHRTVRLENAVSAYRTRVLEQDAIAARERIAWAGEAERAAAARATMPPPAVLEGHGEPVPEPGKDKDTGRAAGGG